MKKSLKKVLSVVLIMISMLALLGQSAFAITILSQNIDQKILEEIEKTNNYVFDAIQETTEKAEKEALKNNKSEEEFEEYLDKLIEELIVKTEKKADKLIEKAAAEGVVLEKSYVDVVICGRTVSVDPFYAHWFKVIRKECSKEHSLSYCSGLAVIIKIGKLVD